MSTILLLILAGSFALGAIAFFVLHRKSGSTAQLDANWRITYSPGMPAIMSTTPEGWHYFDFPTSDGIHYVLKYQSPKNPNMLTMTFRVDSDLGTVYSESVPHGVSPQVRPMIEVLNDNMSDENGRWWAKGDSYILGGDDNQDITISVPIVADRWSSVYGKSDPAAFTASMGNIGQAGFTFGGMYYGHGVYVAAGRARFILKSFQLS